MDTCKNKNMAKNPSPITFWKATFKKRRFGINLIDFSEKSENLMAITIQLWFKVGVAIFFKL